ncbi:MAG: beta-galactosidase GalA [Ferruginibacter sp.]
MKRILLFLTCLFQLALIQAQTKVREKLSMDNGWRFYQGDIAMPVIKGQDMSYSNAKAGKAWGAAEPKFDDTEWQQVKLPHDWAVDNPYDSTENSNQGYRKRGIGWYRRNFKVDKADRGKHLELQFDGIATNCTVWFNGTIMHRNFCGYTSFYIDITAMAKYGDDINNIAIKVDADTQEGWWYEGAGMYRHTWLVKTSPVHIMTDGVYAHPVKNANGSWEIPVEATIENSGKTPANVEIESTLFDKAGKQIVQGKTTASLEPLDQTIGKFSLPVINPTLWTLEDPVLYKVRTVVSSNGKAIDTFFTRCGFRTIKFTTDSGFYLNDKYVKIKGVCNHQDHAGVGTAVPNSLWDFRLKKLKEMGVNGYRCSHNPPAAEFLDACDRMGILVMDENRNFNASPEYMRQLEWMVRRDRNHPSVILWSVFNEEPVQGSEIGYEMVRRMNAEVKKLDTTRPVTAAMSGGLFSSLNVSHAVDVMGFNYQIKDYDRFHKEHPDLPITSSEDVSGLMTRGEYVTDKKKHVIDSYDTENPSWGATHRVAWKAIAERRFLAGCFIWTGFDYRGETQPMEWPTASSSFGTMDLCGFPKTAFYIHQAQWILDKPVLHLVPHWNWPEDSIGKNIKVMAMSNAENVKLYLNGKLIQEAPVDKYEMNTWQVPYQPGKLEAVGFVKGKEVSRFKVETTTEPVGIELIPDRNVIAGDGADAVPITVRVLDAKGRAVETANLPIEFEVNSAGNIIGLGNGDANSHEPDKGNKRSLYNGLAQVILQSKINSSGPLTLTAKSGNLKPASITITVKDTVQIPAVATANPYLILDRWRVSPFSVTRPDPNVELPGYDQNTWQSFRGNQLQTFADGNFATYRTSFKPYAAQRTNGGKLILKAVTGKAEIWLDKKLIATKTTVEPADIIVTVPPSLNEQKLNVLIETEKGQKAGLGGIVTVNALD